MTVISRYDRLPLRMKLALGLGLWLLLVVFALSTASFVAMGRGGTRGSVEFQAAPIEWLAIGSGTALFAAWMLWWMVSRVLAPFDQLRRALERDTAGSGDPLAMQALQTGSPELAALLQAYHEERSRRLEMESAFSASERRLRGVADNLPALIGYVDNTETYRFANAQYVDLGGLDPRAMLGKTIEQVVGAAGRASIDQEIAAVLRGEPQEFERDGTGLRQGRHLLVSFIPDFAATGVVAGFYLMTLDITDRKKAEMRQAQSEQRLKAIANNLPALIAYIDRTETYRFANERFREMMGIDPATIAGKTLQEFLGARACGELRPEIDAALRGERRRFERTGWGAYGETHFVVDYVPDIEADGAVAGFFMMLLDITERKRAELALAASEQRVRAITDNLPAMVSHFDRDLRYTFANAKVGQVFGCEPSELIGRPLHEVRAEMAFDKGMPQMARALAGESVWYETSSIIDGRLRHFEANYVPQVDASGQVLGFYALTFEVTERKKAEAQLRASQQLLDRAGSMAGVGGWMVDIAAGSMLWTDQTRRIHEVDDDYVPSIEHSLSFYDADGQSVIEQAVREGSLHGTPWDLELPFLTAKGRSLWVHTTGEVEFEDGKPVRMFGAFQDVTQRVLTERQLREQAESLHVTLKSIGDGVITADEAGRVRWMNPVAERMTGWNNAAARGKALVDVFKVVNADTRTPAPDPVTLCLAASNAPSAPSRSVLIATDGQEFAIEESASPIRDEDDRVLGTVLVFHDVSEQRRMSDQMTYRATHDELTGLVNRTEFESMLGRVLAAAHDDDSASLMFIDLDHFKLVNDACGHAAGDLLLCQVSALMTKCVRTRDTLARLGGDEFGVILEHCTVDQAQRVAQSICDQLDEFRFVHDGQRFRIGASIGLVPIDAHWPSQAALQQAADTACYAAKEAGRNRLHVWFDTDQVLRAREGEMQWSSRIESALDDGDFVLFAQNLRSIQFPSDRLHFEVLLRLREADGTIVPPGKFLPAAERFHMASRIDRWVVRHVFEWLAAEGGSPADIETVAINLSGQSIGDRAFHRYVLQLLDEISIDVRKLCFEVTETAAITNLADATTFIKSMRQLGMRVALDDFGAGASSFGYLKNLPVDYLKIDGQFIRQIETDALDFAAVRCFHEVATAIGVKTVAEFVETEGVLKILREIGIDYAQGYLVHRPEPLDTMLRRHREARVPEEIEDADAALGVPSDHAALVSTAR